MSNSRENDTTFNRGDIILSQVDDKIYIVLSCHCKVIYGITLKNWLTQSTLNATYDEIIPINKVESMKVDVFFSGIEVAQTAIENVISSTDRVLRTRLEKLGNKEESDTE